jgi:septation ring formation regulator EzrA
MKQVKTNLKKRVKELKRESDRRSFQWFVLNTIEKEGEDSIESFISDVLNYGCINGSVSALTYTWDIHKIFDRYYYDIENKVEEVKEEIGELQNRYELDVKTLYTFVAFEETVRDIAEALGLDI